MSRTHFALCCALLLIVAGVIPSGTALAQVSAGDLRPAQLLAQAKSWGYQLQNPDPDELAAIPYDVIVIDYSRTGSDDQALTATDTRWMAVTPVRNSGRGIGCAMPLRSMVRQHRS